jgi:hypothetical protein
VVRIKILPLLVCCLLSLAIPVGALADNSFSGNFTGPKLSMEITSADNGSYTGSIHLGDQVFPFKAQTNGGQLAGTFNTNGHDYAFTATLAGDALTFTSGTSTYQLSRNSGNPLDTNPGTPAPNQDSSNKNAPAGYVVAAATDKGKAWVTKKPGITTVAAGLEAVIPDLSTFFGSNIVIKGAFEDTKDHLSGAASFTGTFGGQPVVGLITCRLADNEAKISVTCCLASASQADWAKLNTSAATIKPHPSDIKLTRADFPDGTGSIGVADGWTLKSNSICDPLSVVGPDSQFLGAPGYGWITVVMPDSPRIRQMIAQRKQLEESYERMGRQPPPPMPFKTFFPVVAPFGPPDQALPVVFPQFRDFMAKHNLQLAAFDRITSVKPHDPILANMTSQLLEYDTTRDMDGTPRHLHSQGVWSSMPPGQYMTDQWSLSCSQLMTAPVESFDKDVITMQAMSRSMKINWDTYMKVDEERFEARMRANQIAFDERMKDQERQRIERQKEFQEHQEQVAEQEDQKSRIADDWIEYAGGYRTVIDNQTGQSVEISLGNVDNVVNYLNQGDPNRFQQIPLRDTRNPTN